MHFPLLDGFYQRLLFLLPFATDTNFNYDDPRLWYLKFPSCLGYRQSPIAISTHKALTVDLPSLVFGLYDEPFDELPRLRNNGHTIEFEVKETFLGDKPFITGSWLRELYEADMVHFHWGSPTHKGSEHMINGRRFDLEMHIVHRNTKYATLEMARNYEDGIAVIAVLFKVVKSPNVFYPVLNNIYQTLSHLALANSTSTTTVPVSLNGLMGNIDREHFYIYHGSLTTPPCSEAVTWIVFSDAVPISYAELPRFWNLFDRRGHRLLNNFRPLQSSQYRKVYQRLSHSATNFVFNELPIDHNLLL